MHLPLVKQSLADAVYLRLSGQILRDELTAGDELPAERILAEQLQINRGAVREGLKRLQQAALVAIRHGGATQVLNWRESAGLELLPQMLVNATGSLNIEAARGILTLRSTLAPAIARLTAKAPNPALATRLESLVTQLRDAHDAHGRQRAALEFWRQLVIGSDNLGFQLAFNSMNHTYRRIQDLLTQLMDSEFRDSDNLQGIVDAIRDGLPEQAAEHAARHVAKGEAALNTALSALRPPRSL